MRSIFTRFFLFALLALLLRFAYVVSLTGFSCTSGDFCFFSSRDPLLHGTAPAAAAAIGGASPALWSTRDWRKNVEFYSAVFQDLIVDGFLSTSSKSLCINTPAGFEVLALHEIGVSDTIGLHRKKSPPLIVAGDLLHQLFDNDTRVPRSLITVDVVPAVAVVASGSPGCNPSSDYDARLPGCNPSSDHDARLRSGARSGLKRELASILRSQVDSTLSRTRSGKSSTSDRHTLNKKAKKSPLAADQSPITPILSPEAAAAATSIQNGTHAANLERSQTGMAVLVTPGRRFTRSSSIAGEGDPAARSKTNVDEQAATAVLEIPGDGSNLQTSVLISGPSNFSEKQRVKFKRSSVFIPGPSNSSEKQSVKFKRSRSKNQIDGDGAGMALLATPGRRFTRSMLMQTPAIAREGDPAAGSKTNRDEQATAVPEIPDDSSKQIDEDGTKQIVEDGAGMALMMIPERRFTKAILVQTPSIAGEGDPARGLKTNVDEQATAVLEIPGDGSNMQTSGDGSNMQTLVFTPDPSEDVGGALLMDSVSIVPEKLEQVNVTLQTQVTAAGDEYGSGVVPIPIQTSGDGSNMQTSVFTPDPSEDVGDALFMDSVSLVPEKLEQVNVALQTLVTPAGDEDGSGAVPILMQTSGDGSNMQMQISVFTPDPSEDVGGALLMDSVSVVPEKLEQVNVAFQTPVTAAGDADGSGAVPIPVSIVAQGKNKFTRSKKTDEDGCGDLNADNVVLEKSEKVDVEALTPLKKTDEDGCGDLSADNVVPEKVDVEALTPISSARHGKTKFTRSKKRTNEDGRSKHEVLARRFTRSALNTPKIDQEMSTKKEIPSAKLDDDECNVSIGTSGNCVLRSARSTVEILAVKHDGDECKVSNSTPGKRVLRSTRSTVETLAVKHDEEFNADEDSDLESDPTETDTSESSDFEESKSRHKPRKMPKKKMELKMSKKIGLTKLPGNLRDLFATGLLEGYPVTYNCNVKQHISLEGIIRGNVISCNCPSCKGSKTFSGYNWEVHAGSNKKHPSDHIFLENGKSLHDVLKACMSAPLNNLEATIQNVIGAPPRKRPFICQTCGVSFRSSHIGEPAPSCDSCLKTEQLRPSNGTRSIGKAAKTASLPNPSGRITKKDIGLHKLVFMDDILPEGTEVAYFQGGKRLLGGYIKDSGIYCLHCNVVVKPSVFEAHAGRGSRRKPFHNIYTSNGVSLHELSVSLSKGRKLSAHENDDLCNICNDVGDLLLCDVCPRAFHRGCLGLLEVPEGDWHCPPCQTMHQKEKFVEHNDNAIAAGRVQGVDPIEQIIKRCIRIFTSPGTDEGACVLCRLHDFSKAAFGDRTVLICDQCEKEYHVGCLREHNMCDLNALPEGDWFCCADCQRINGALQELILRGQEPLKDLDADIIRKKQNEKDLSKDGFDVSWRFLSGKTASADSRLLLSETVSLFSESFDPIVGATGRDLIPSIVNGENMGDQDFRGMYCVVLTSNSRIVSAGILRILGSELAELPLVATSREAQGQGYFQALFSCIERLLGSLNVKHFVLPAAEEALSIWTNKFGFTKIASDQLREYSKGVHPMVFHGTTMLHKPVPPYRDSS